MIVLLVISLLMSALGFIKYLYFMTVGYGLAVAAMALAMMIVHPIYLYEGALAILLMVYGLRLSGFLLYRELKTFSYKKTFEEAMKPEEKMPLFVKVVMWIAVAILYVMEVSPLYFRIINHAPFSLTVVIGAIIMILGIVIESLADSQKSAAKKINPHRFVDTGLYRYVRTPNYFGEILMWTGLIVSGIGALKGYQWIIAILGYVLIVYVMLSGARRLEIKQDQRYGDDPEYQAYIAKTPIIFPLIPLYHLKNNSLIK